jgi:transposase
MEHVAIDLGGRESHVCVRSAEGKILEETRWQTRQLEEYLARRPASRVIVETCAEAFRVADVAKELGHEARVVPATLVRALGVGERKTKTDKRDARKLSEMSCRMEVPSVHIPSAMSRELKTRLGMRQAIVSSRTMLINTVRGWLRAEAISIPRSADAFVRRVFEAMRGAPLPTFVEQQLKLIDQLTDSINAADKEIAQIAKAHPVCPRLMTVPGVGPVTALQFVAVIDEMARFKSAHELEAYLGLTPGEDSSSTRQRRTSITKAGSSAMRWCLVQAAWAARRSHARRPLPMVAWSLEIEKRRGKRIAIIALARKLAGILFALWRDNSTYDARRSAQPPHPVPVTP